MTLNSTPNSAFVTSEPNSEVSLKFATRGISAISIVICAEGGNFNNQSCTIYVSNGDIVSDFIKLREVQLGYKNLVSNSWTRKNQLYHGSPLHYEFVQITVPALGSSVRSKILVSGR
jgi:hypothetical protein